MSPDWAASPTPVPYASLPYPKSLDLYSYVQNNPVKSTDPTGHDPCTIDGEKHNSAWCWAHKKGWVETNKEYQERKKKEAEQDAEYAAFVRKHPEFSPWNMLQGPLVTLLSASAIGASESGSGNDSTVTPEENAAAGAASEAGVARTMIKSVPQPVAEGETVVGPNGTAIKIPAGWIAEPARGDGIVYRAPGTTDDANTIRVMGPDAQGRNPSGRVIIYNSQAQPIVPSTGKPGSRPDTHTPL
jgi:hypothetical protein